MPGGSSADDALKCAACGCHRSFHRKECPDGGNLTPNSNSSSFYHGRVVPNGSPSNVPLLLPPPHPHHHSITPQLLTHRHRQKQQPHPPQLIPPGFVGFTANSGGGTTTESSSEERNLGPAGAPPQRQFASAPKKRHRTKFTPEQKNKLLGFAERVGWRIQKQDEAAVEAFCAEAAVSRQVLKVWMHNNKHTLRKQQPQPQQEQELYQQLHHQEVHHQEVEEDVCED
ncbi:zinc-finger homeodomain protein 6-like [Typha latifolia]|uniref:zinc-finger homeodomain protein 6-like n=1 Tax=Typha latifolia TaxID=4733 RepID=UPI003C2DC25A